MKILFVTSEFAGLGKVGRLGDASASLPVALRQLCA
jgi:glycogen synthase